MKTANLKLRFNPQAVRETAAWHIAGDDVRTWLSCAIALGGPHRRIRFLPLPSSKSDRRPSGALILHQDDDREGGNREAGDYTDFGRRASVASAAYGKVADRLFLPVEAQIEPIVAEDELRQLLDDAYVYVWHPAIGLVGCEPDMMLCVNDLISKTQFSDRRWDQALPGVAIGRRLLSLTPDEAPSFESIIAGGMEDIGSQSDETSQLPPSDFESKSGPVHNLVRNSAGMLARAVRWVTRSAAQAGAGATGSAEESATSRSGQSWLGRIEQWASEKIAQVSAELEAQRHKELLRLMKLLETDPDKGLRFAVPMGGDAHRGIAPPGGRLPEHDMNFNLGRLGGGRPVDDWDLSPQYQLQLIARYRELADREVRLGRHRRAAYIYAELLADFDAAAGALFDGRHWREAAVIYRDRLQRPLTAAQCFEHGGLWMEAIAQYEQLDDFEKAGDLFRQIGQEDNARDRYLGAVKRLKYKGDNLTVARLLEEKLDDIDAAIEELEAGWPQTAQAAQCLEMYFETLGRVGRHDLAEGKLRGFREQGLSNRKPLALVNVLERTAQNYPQATIRNQAADNVRVIASQQLPSADVPATRQLLTAITRLAPHDQLLGRDCQRYSSAAAKSLRQPDAKKTSSLPKSLRLVRTIQLPRERQWDRAIGCGLAIFVAGANEQCLYLTRTSWNGGDLRSVFWQFQPRQAGFPVVLAANPNGDGRVIAHQIGGALLADRDFPASDACPERTIAGAIRGMSDGNLGAERTSHGMTWLVEFRNEECTLIALGAEGQQVSTMTLNSSIRLPAENWLSMLPLPVHCRSDQVFVGIKDELFVCRHSNSVDTIEFPSEICGLAGSAPNTRSRVAVSLAQGGRVFWGDDQDMRPFADNMVRPLAAFTRSGHLIAASEGRCEIYKTAGFNVELVAEISDPTLNPVSVIAAPGPGTELFAIVSASGEIKVFELC